MVIFAKENGSNWRTNNGATAAAAATTMTMHAYIALGHRTTRGGGSQKECFNIM